MFVIHFCGRQFQVLEVNEGDLFVTYCNYCYCQIILQKFYKAENLPSLQKVEEEHGEVVNSELASNLSNVKSISNLGLDTTVEFDDLDLQDGGEYQVFVMATDESGICSLATAMTTVDVSPPNEGTLCVGPEFDMV